MVALLTDFGLSDPYVGEVKAVIKSISPHVDVVDITHDVRPFNVFHGAFILFLSYAFFPKGTVFVAVVDPGVGTGRRGIVVRTCNYWFVGPDNGLLFPAASSDGIRAAYVINDRRYERPYGETFHGRDVFAKVAAEIVSGRRPSMSRIGEGSIVKLEIMGRVPLGAKRFQLLVLHIDRFGNVITNLSSRDFRELGLEGHLKVDVEGRSYIAKVVRAYGEAEPGDLVALIGGTGFLELAVNRGNASELLKVEPGDAIVLELG